MQPIRRFLFLAIVLATGFSLAGTWPAAAQPALVNLHPAGASESLAVDANNAGQVVGAYLIHTYDGSGKWLSTTSTAVFWSSAGVMTDLVDGEWTGGNTYARGINDDGLVFGSIGLPFVGASTGAFLWDSTNGITNVPKLVHGGKPDWEFTPHAMNEDGWLIGGSYTEAGVHGWIYRHGVDGVAEEITNPASPGSRIAATAINNLGQVAGHAYYGTFSAVIWEKDAGGNVIITDLAPNLFDSNARAINDAGQVAIQAQDGKVYLWKDGVLTPAVLPNDYTGVQVVGLDESGRVYGIGQRSAGSPPLQLWMWQNGVLTVCPVEGQQFADYERFRINNEGQMTSYVMDSSGTPHGFLWNAVDGASGLQMLDGLEGGGSAGLGLNDCGKVAGYATELVGFDYLKRACVWGRTAPCNHLPVLSNVPASATIPELAPYTFTATATDDNPADTLTFSLSTDAPSGAAIDPTTGVFTWTPFEEQGPGIYTFTLSVTDGADTASQNVILTVDEVNNPPDLYVSSRYAGVVGIPVTFMVRAYDPDEGNILTFSLVNAPDGAVINTIGYDAGIFSWTPTVEGGFTFDVLVIDSGGLHDTRQVTIEVYPADTPILMDLGVYPGFEHSSAADINASGMVVGDCINGNRVPGDSDYIWIDSDRRAFVRQNGEMTLLPLLEGYPYSHATAVNAQGQVVGWCFTDITSVSDYRQACLWEQAGGGWTVTGLGWLTGGNPEYDASVAYDINANGLVYGQSSTVNSGNNYEFFLWESGKFVPFRNLPVDPNTGRPYPYLQISEIGDDGSVIGRAGSGPAKYDGPFMVWKAPKETVKVLPDAYDGAVNASGQVAGVIIPNDADGYPNAREQYLFFWDPATPDEVTNLGVPVSTDPDYFYTDVSPLALSDEGDILFYGWIHMNGADGWVTTPHLWVYADGLYTDLADDLAGVNGQSVMSPAGYVAGFFETGYDWDCSSFYWDGTGTAMVLPGLGGDTRAVALNDHKQIAGTSVTADGKVRAVVWSFMVPGNQPPIANAGPDQAVTATNGTATVTLDGAVSSDPDGDTLTFAWTESGSQIATGVNPSVTLDEGTHSIILTVTDPDGATGSDTVTITVTGEPVGESLTISDATAAKKNKVILVSMTFTNPTSQSATDIVLTTATLGGSPVLGTVKVGTIPAGASTPVTLPFKDVPSGPVSLVMEGTCSLGPFACTQTVNVN